MNEELLCAAIFERAIADYENSARFLASRKNIMSFHGHRRFRRENSTEMLEDVRSFATGPEAMQYAGGSERVIRAFRERLDEIDRQYHIGEITDMVK